MIVGIASSALEQGANALRQIVFVGISGRGQRFSRPISLNGDHRNGSRPSRVARVSQRVTP